MAMDFTALQMTRPRRWTALAVSVLAAALTGCAVYDVDALPAALQAKVQDYKQCDAQFAGRGTNVAIYECYLAAEKQYATNIRLQRTDLYEIYAARVRLIARDTDAGRMTTDERNRQSEGAFADYRASLSRAVADTAAAQAELGAGTGALLGGMAQGYALRGQGAREPLYSPASPPATAPQPSANTQPQLAPNGTYVSGGGLPTLCPDGSYVAGSCQMAPNGKFVGN